MDFTLTEEQTELAGLARTIFTEQSPVERVREIEATDERVDRALWATLAQAGLLAVALPEAHGGAGYGFYEVAMLLEEHGRAVAPIPFLETLVGSGLLADFAADALQARWLPGVAEGNVVIALALAEEGNADPLRPAVQATPSGDGYTLSGEKVAVVNAHVADLLLVTASLPDGTAAVFAVTPGDGVTLEHQIAVHRAVAPNVTLSGAAAQMVGGPGSSGESEAGAPSAAARALVQRYLVGLGATAVGAAAEAVQRAADYTSNRVQFGRPLSTNQGILIECADAFIATEGMRVTVQNAAWRIAEGVDATREVLVAKWWAADAGLRATHAALHLHGGLGADIDYPIHRYLFWCKYIAAALGGPQAQLARLGGVLADAS